MTKKYKIGEELMGSLSELTLMADQMRFELEALLEEMDGMFYAEDPEWEESEELDETGRNQRGFGSTGSKA